MHGAGAQRSDPKSGDAKEFPQGRGPQGDDVRILNYVRAVRGGAAMAAPEQGHDSSPATAPTARAARPAGTAVATPGRSRAARFITRLDKDGDGRVSRAEFDGPLGHESPATTHRYIEADLTMKERALQSLQEPPSRRLRFRATDRLLSFLDGL